MSRPDVRARLKGRWLVLAVAAIMVTMCGILALVPTTADSEDRASADDASKLVVQQPKSALFVGDSFTAGTSGLGRSAYPFLMCRAVGWGCNVDAQGETGYIDDGRRFHIGTQRAVDRLDGDKSRFVVDLLIADLGRNDIGVDSAQDILAAATDFFAKARSFWPDATMVAIIPAFLNAAPYDNYLALKAGFDTISKTFKVKVIDPLADGWYRGVDAAALVGVDGVHPSAYGNQLTAERLEDSLASLGLAEPRLVP